MANVLLTTKCNLHCAYCFAQERMHNKRNQVMSLADVQKVIAFLKRSNHPYFRAMGGEPTLHPEFPRIAESALEAGLRLDLLSNATWPDKYNRLFNRIAPSRIVFLLNIDHPDTYSGRVWEHIEHNLAAIADRGTVTLSFNVFETSPRYQYILDLATRYHLDKVRMSFSLPVLGAQNAYLKWDDYRQMAPFVVEFARKCEEIGVELRLDNALPLCIFSFEQAGELLMKGVLNFQHNARCEPIVDIGPDLTVWCCFCLSALWNRHLDDFENLEQVQEYYRAQMAQYQCRLFPVDECYSCRYRELWGCQGGCLTHTLMRHAELPAEAAAGAQEGDGWKPGAVLSLAGAVEVQRFDLPAVTYVIHQKELRLEMEVDGSFEPLLALLDGRYSAAEVLDRFVAGSQDPHVRGSLAEFSRKAMRDGADALLRNLLHEGFLEERAA